MGIIYYSEQDIKKLIPLYNTYVEECAGGYGEICKAPFENKVIKLFKNPIKNKQQIENALSFKDNEILAKNNVILPVEAVFVDQVLKGYSMRLVRGYSILELQSRKYIPEISFSKFKKAYLEAIEGIKNIENISIKMQDMYRRNIMYDLDRDCFCFIDIDQWYKTEEVSSLVDDFKQMVNLNKMRSKMNNRHANFLYMNRIYYSADEISKLLDEEIIFPQRFIKNNLIINVCKDHKGFYFIDQIEGENEKNYIFIKTIDTTDNKQNMIIEDSLEKRFKLQKMNKALKTASFFAIQLEDTSMQENILWSKEHNCFIFLGNIKSFNQVEVPKKNSLSENIKNCIEKIKVKQKIFSKLLR